jgi:endonuclease/exonuclease/phosphatase family metal-dependent hydrolase
VCTTRSPSLLSWLGALSLLTLAAALVSADPSEGKLEVATYNVHGLPSFVTGDETLVRLRAISPRLRGLDVVGIQEDFLDHGHPLLLGKVDQPVRLRFSRKIEGRVYGSGLTTLARGKLVAKHEVHFTTFHGIAGSGSDGFASKGFQITRVQLAAGVELDVYNAHLDAGGSAGDSRARAVQVAQITSAMRGVSGGRAVLFLGDTNLKAKRSADGAILQRWFEATGLRCACAARRERCCGRIDRVLYRSGVGLRLSVEAWKVEDFRDSRRAPLSDHSPIRARLHWRREAF